MQSPKVIHHRDGGKGGGKGGQSAKNAKRTYDDRSGGCENPPQIPDPSLFYYSDETSLMIHPVTHYTLHGAQGGRSSLQNTKEKQHAKLSCGRNERRTGLSPPSGETTGSKTATCFVGEGHSLDTTPFCHMHRFCRTQPSRLRKRNCAKHASRCLLGSHSSSSHTDREANLERDLFSCAS